MKYKFSEIKKSDLHEWAFLVALGQVSPSIVDEIDATSIDVRLTIDGHEVSFFEIIERLYEHIDMLAQDKAKQMIDELASESYSALYDIQEMAKSRLSDIEG